MIFYCSVEYSTSWKTLKILSSKSVIPLLIHSVAPTTWLSSRTFTNSMFHELENVLRKKNVFTIFVFLYFLLRQKVLNQTRLATKLFQPAIETKRGKNIPRIFKTLFLSDKRKVIIACKTSS